MNKERSSLTVILALVCGLVGVMISNQLSVDKPVFAETEKIITAEKFVLVDKGDVRGYWTTDNDGNVSLTMNSKVGKISVVAGDQENLLWLDARVGTVGLRVADKTAGLLLIDRNNRKRGEIALDGLTVAARLMGNAGQVLWGKP